MRRPSFKALNISAYRTKMMPAWSGEVIRYLIGSLLNVVVGYGSYLILLHWFGYEVSYAVAYVIGIAVSYVFNALYVFRQPIRLRSALRYPFVYLMQFLLGLVLLKVLIDGLHVATKLAPLLVAMLTIPATFLASRIIMRAN